MERGIREFLAGLGVESACPSGLAPDELLRETPRRVAAAFADDLLAGYVEDPDAHLEPVAVGSAGSPGWSTRWPGG